MKKTAKNGFVDKVSGDVVHYWIDCYGCEWMATNKWGFRVKGRTPEQKKLYRDIEGAIIAWNIDGKKTAGTLTRQIMELIKNSNI
jgi:hypothetical protein